MKNEQLNTAVYEKAFAEQENYREWLLSQSPEEILNHTYEYTLREDILISFEFNDLSDRQCRALLKSPCLLADVYGELDKRETGHMNDVREAIVDRANAVIRAGAVKAQKESR